MSIAYSRRIRQTSQSRFQELLASWLRQLPASGFAGSVGDLQDSLTDFQAGNVVHSYALVPAGAGLSKALAAAESVILAAGFRLTFTRTATSRTITLARIR
jgi:hypothetical protein